MAFAWRAMDAFYEEDERIVGHAADPYHRIDIRQTGRHLVVQHNDQVTIDGTKLRLEPGQAVVPHGVDRDLTTGEIAPRS